MNKNKLMSKIEPQAWKNGTDWQWPEGRREEVIGGKKRKGLIKEHVWITHGHGLQCGDWLWEWVVRWAEEAKGGRWNNCNKVTIKKIKNKFKKCMFDFTKQLKNFQNVCRSLYSMSHCIFLIIILYKLMGYSFSM